jgi:hypothetical protein
LGIRVQYMVIITRRHEKVELCRKSADDWPHVTNARTQSVKRVCDLGGVQWTSNAMLTLRVSCASTVHPPPPPDTYVRLQRYPVQISIESVKIFGLYCMWIEGRANKTNPVAGYGMFFVYLTVSVWYQFCEGFQIRRLEILRSFHSSSQSDPNEWSAFDADRFIPKERMYDTC